MATNPGDPLLIGTIRATGDAGPIGQPTEIDFDPVRGLVINETWEDVGDNSGLAAYASLFIREGIGFTWKRSGARSELRARYSGGTAGSGALGDSTRTNWQLLNNVAQRSILKSPFARSLEASFPGILQAIKSVYGLFSQGEEDQAQDVRAKFIGDADGDPRVGFDRMLDYLLEGTTHFDVSQPVLKGSTSISNFNGGNDLGGDGHMNSIWPTATLLGLPIPRYLSRLMSSYAEPPGIPANYFWGWLQMGSTAITDAQNRISVSTEWVLDAWSTDFYPVV